MLITGVQGQIGSYLSEILNERDYIIYGLVRSIPINPFKGVIYLKCDISDTDTLKKIIIDVNPDEIYHFAAQTDATISVKEPEKTLWVNGNVVMAICEAILASKEPIKLFVANSSELFKGNSSRKIDESHIDFHPKNPYGIGKLTAYWISRYYREHFGLHICNGIIFNAESPRRKPGYVTSKIAREVVKIAKDTGCIKLRIGNIDSWRDWIHAYDVANAARMILSEDHPGDYVISLNEVHSVRYLIEQSFLQLNIEIIWVGECGSIEEKGVSRQTGGIHVEIDKTFFRSYETVPNILKGDNSKLLGIGWEPRYKTVIDIMKDMIDSQEK